MSRGCKLTVLLLIVAMTTLKATADPRLVYRRQTADPTTGLTGAGLGGIYNPSNYLDPRTSYYYDGSNYQQQNTLNYNPASYDGASQFYDQPGIGTGGYAATGWTNSYAPGMRNWRGFGYGRGATRGRSQYGVKA